MLGVQLHLILNHISLIGIPVALAFLGIGYLKKNDLLQKTALLILILVSLMIIPTYLTGDMAEEALETTPAFSEHQVETHEESAELALTLTLILGGFSGLTLLLWHSKFKSISLYAVFSVALLSVIGLSFAAHQGGLIRHTELQLSST